MSVSDETAINNAVISYNALTSNGKALVSNAAKLNACVAALSAAKAAECIRLIDLISEPVSLNDETAIGTARSYYNNNLTDAERANVTNYAKLTNAESALAKLKDETPGGSTTSVTVTINGITYEVSENTKKAVEAMQAIMNPTDISNALPDDFTKLTSAQQSAILEAARLYNALTSDEKLFATNYETFKTTVLDKLGESFHYDKASGIDARDNKEDNLPWYVKINITPKTVSDDELSKIRETLGEKADVLVLEDITFTNMLDKSEFHPSSPIKIKIPLTEEMKAHDSIAVVHIDDNGKYNYIQGVVKDGYVEFEASDFSLYGVASFTGNWNNIVATRSASSFTWLWIVIAVAIVGIALLVVMKRKNKMTSADKEE